MADSRTSWTGEGGVPASVAAVGTVGRLLILHRKTRQATWTQRGWDIAATRGNNGEKGKGKDQSSAHQGFGGKKGITSIQPWKLCVCRCLGFILGTSKRYKVLEQIRSLICPFFWLGPLTSNALTIGKPRDKTLRMNFCRKKSLKINSPEKKTSNHQSSYIW
jgi:hypothetical protein